MRLTLRTLLAYMDDLLEPSEAKALGEKVKESPEAQELMERIKDVIRRRRLTAPAVSGPGVDVDANLVAEYLDNTLSPAGVADLEQVCLDSDLHLAEVAACHQILTLVLGEPVGMNPTSRERMYALAPTAPVGTATTTVTMAAAPTVPMPVVMKPPATEAPVRNPLAPVSAPTTSSVTIPSTAPAAFHETIPEYLRPKSAWRKSLPYIGVVLLLAVWGGALFYDPTLMENFFPKAPAPAVADVEPLTPEDGLDVPAPDEPVTEDAAPTADGNPELTDPEALDPAIEVAMVDPVTPETMPPEASGLDPEPPADAPAAATPDMPETPENPAPQVPVAPPVKPAAADKVPEKVVAVAPVKPLPPKVAVPVAEYVSQEGVVLRYDAERANWYPLPHRAQVYAHDQLAVPEPFSAVWWLGKVRHRATALGPAVLGIGVLNGDIPELTLTRGRLILQPADPRAAGDVPLPYEVHLKLPGGNWTVQLMTAETTLGIEVDPREPDLFEKAPTHWSARIHLAQGTMRLRGPDEDWRDVNGPESIALGQPASDLAAAMTLPSWVLDPKPSTITATNARHVEKEFSVDESAHEALMGLVEDRRPEISRLAVGCLGLAGDYAILVQTLDRSAHEEARLEAIRGLRTWLVQTEQAPALLKTELEASLYPAEAEVVYRLLWGYTDKDARDPQISAQLVEWLNHDRLAIRELSWHYIKLYSGRRFDYRADGPIRQRRSAVQQWTRILEKDGALIPATKTPASAAPAPAAPTQPSSPAP